MEEQQKVNDKYSLQEVLNAIKGSSGIKATIQRKLGCNSRSTVDSYLRRYATAQQAYDEENETMGDIAESVVISAIKNKDVAAAQWYLVKKHRDRGYGDKSETTHSGEVTVITKGYATATPDDWNEAEG